VYINIVISTAFRRVMHYKMLKYMILDCNCAKFKNVWLARNSFEKCFPGARNALQTKKSLSSKKCL
jgi:hypothetical protein